ncbi:MAG: hydroxymethylbilane synthase [SAR324 cluster bacterium]|uniref:Porphobilinogen deaminase n=1 Tax=SAR324 cluster bacterium TaxID=2024889 RepID=A0A2A4T4U9_9DELT|nr:MAG: hydroxymethylbilane synthase [SAR324 cluster bacterium]
MKKTLKIATRSSKLALWQANWVKDQIEAKFPHVSVELLEMKTQGDIILDTPLSKIGGKGLFVKELEVAILKDEADIAVHSMKDVPIELPEGLEISVITEREEPSDAFVSNQYSSFESLPQKAIVGTSSLRRIAQLQRLRPDISFISLRGNVNTRLRKLDEGNFDAIILASAGLIRLGFEERIAERISVEISLPAIGQGVVGIESRVDDEEVLSLITHLRDPETTDRVAAERALLTRLNGGCQVPIGGFATLEGDNLTLTAMVASPDGKRFLKLVRHGKRDQAAQMGVQIAEELLEQGGREILREVGIEVQ